MTDNEQWLEKMVRFGKCLEQQRIAALAIRERVEAIIETEPPAESSNYIPLNIKIKLTSGTLAGRLFTVQISAEEFETLVKGGNK